MKISWGSSNAKIRKAGFIKGIFLGIIEVALNISSFYLMINLVKSHPLSILPVSFFFTVLFPLLVIILLVLATRKSIGGFWSFKQAVTAIFIMLLTTYAILSIGRDVLFVKLVEPNMVQKIGASMVESRVAKDKQDGMKPDDINKDIAFDQKNYNSQINNSEWAVLQGIPENIVVLFVLSIIFAAIFKKDPPLTVVEEPIK